MAKEGFFFELGPGPNEDIDMGLRVFYSPQCCIYIFVGSRFVADRNEVGFARKTALTISFVERGFERLGLDR